VWKATRPDGGPTEEDLVRLGAIRSREALRLQPGDYLADVAFTHPKRSPNWAGVSTCGSSATSGPAAGRAIGQERFVGWRWLEYERNSVHLHAAVNPTLIELWPRPPCRLPFRGTVKPDSIGAVMRSTGDWPSTESTSTGVRNLNKCITLSGRRVWLFYRFSKTYSHSDQVFEGKVAFKALLGRRKPHRSPPDGAHSSPSPAETDK